MKLKKRYIYLTTIISIVSFLCLVILHFRLYANVYDYFYNILGNGQLMIDMKSFAILIVGGVFTGAILTLLLSVVDYFDERRKVLEEIYYVSEKIQKFINRIEFFLPNEPWDVVKDYLIEMENNKSIDKFNEEIEKQMSCTKNKEDLHDKFIALKSEKTHEAEGRFKETLREQLNNFEKQYCDKETYLKDKCDEKNKQYLEQIDNVLKSYLVVNNLDMDALTSAYAKLDFMFSNGAKRKHIHQNLYQKQYDVISFIKIRTVLVEDYFKNGKRNIAAMLGLIEAVQKKLLGEEEDFYYKKHCYEIYCEMTKILVYAYGKRKQGQLLGKNYYTVKMKPGVIERILQENETENKDSSV